MRLSTRLSLFFLAALAVCLVGFSLTLCWLASSYLHRRADERLETAMAMLVSSAELDADGIDWEPRGQALAVRDPWLQDAFFWRVYDLRGQLIDSSESRGSEQLLDPSTGDLSAFRTVRDRAGQSWRILGQQVIWDPKADSYETPDPRRKNVEKLPGVRLVVGLSLAGNQGTLKNLALASLGLSVGLWGTAFLVGERLARSALRPLSEMASAAHGLGAFDQTERLPTQPGNDELTTLGLEINGLLDRLHESFERQRRFTGDASHQLRTPLTVIQGHVDLALRLDRSEEEYRRTLVLVQQKTRQLRQIVEALLYLSRADTEASQPIAEVFDLADWLSEYVSARTDPRAVDLSYKRGTFEPIPIRAQPVLLGELLNNLLENASKYSESGTPIVLSLERGEGFAEIAISDRGHGISEEDLPRIFEPFHRGRDARDGGTAGTGLGLSIAWRLADSMGARLSVESHLGQGSTFFLRIAIIQVYLDRVDPRIS